jgi:uncharacterized membrane protein YbhN (UPF0104 family)
VYESTRVSLVSSIGNFFASSGVGLGFRAIYLKRRHGLQYQDYITTLYGNYLLIFIVNALVGVVSLYFAPHHNGTQFLGAFLFFGGLTVVSLLFCFVRIPAPPAQRAGQLGKVQRLLHMMTDGWQGIARNINLVSSLTGLIVLQLAITVFLTWLETSALGLHLPLYSLLLLSVLSALSVFVSITPANIGVKEIVYILTSSVIGLSTSQIVSIAIIDRGVLFITLGALWLAVGKSRLTAEELSNAG